MGNESLVEILVYRFKTDASDMTDASARSLSISTMLGQVTSNLVKLQDLKQKSLYHWLNNGI